MPLIPLVASRVMHHWQIGTNNKRANNSNEVHCTINTFDTKLAIYWNRRAVVGAEWCLLLPTVGSLLRCFSAGKSKSLRSQFEY